MKVYYLLGLVFLTPGVGRVASIGADCNGNEIDDEVDLEAGPLTFRLPRFLPAGGRPTAVAAGDLDGDGRVDIAAAIDDATGYAVFLNRPQGFRDPPRKGALGNAAYSVVVGDWDGDGDLDLALASPYADVVSILRNDGTPDVGLSVVASVTVSGGPEALAMDDIDRDGDLDLVATLRSAEGVIVLTNDGRARFVVGPILGAGTPMDSIALGDLDGDGLVDIAGCGGSHVALFFGAGAGTFDLAVAVGSRDSARATIGDVDRDGDLDVLTAGAEGVVVLVNDGTGALVERGVETPPLDASRGLVAADVNADGDLDLIVLQDVLFGPSGAIVLLGDGTGEFPHRTAFGVGETPRHAAVADVDSDGLPDLVAAHWESSAVLVARNLGEGVFHAAQDARIDGTPAAVGDLDGDGHPDLLISNRRGANVNLSLMYHVRDGIYSDPVEFRLGSSIKTASMIDLDRDSDLDVVACESSTLWLLYNRGDGDLDTSQNRFVNSLTQFVIGDVDLDGTLEIILGLTEPRITMRSLATDGSLGVERSFRATKTPSRSGLALGDVDGDGLPDVVSLDADTGELAALWNSGRGGFEEPAFVSASAEPVEVVLADVDRDERADLLLVERDAGEILIVLGREDRDLRVGARLPAGVRPLGLVAGDLDGDGDVDLATGCEDSHALIAWKNVGAMSFERQEIRDVSTSYRAALAADANLDGSSDLFLVDIEKDTVHVLLNLTIPPLSRDCNGNLVPDECDGLGPECVPLPAFHRGDANGDGAVDISDGVFVLRFLFLGDVAPRCREALDSDNNRSVQIGDSIVLFRFLFLDGPPPSDPGPVTSPCGPDPDPAGSAGDLGCEAYDRCER